MTRSAFSFGAAAAVVVGLAGCMVGGPEPTSSTGDYMTFEEFEAQTFHEPWEDGVYIVNGDTPVVDIKALEEFWSALYVDGGLIVNTQGGQDTVWNSTTKLNLTYCVSTASFGTNKTAAVNAMASAANAWKAVANINFVYLSQYDNNCTSSQTNVLFDVNKVNSGGQYLARAFFPNNGRSSRNVLIDTSAFGSIPPWTLTGVIRHELGHVLGFRHEHTRPEAGTCFEDNNWRPLTSYDGSSVMHYPQCNGTQNGDLVITTKDAQGAAALYGAPGGGGGDPPPPPPPPPTGGVAHTGSADGSVQQNRWIYYAPLAVVPGTRFTVTMTGSGDPDLYVRWAGQPTTSQWNCRPYLDGPSETCSLDVPSSASNAYIGIRGYTSASYHIDVAWVGPN